jgi:hypothetical protein
MSGNAHFYYFPLDLYRLGGVKDDEPWDKMDHVRHRDIRNIEFIRNGLTWLHPGPQGGISLFDDVKTAPIKGNHWFKIPKDAPDQSKLPPGLALYKGTEKKGKATHYTIYPTVEMPLDNFKLLLRSIPGLEYVGSGEKIQS